MAIVAICLTATADEQSAWEQARPVERGDPQVAGALAGHYGLDSGDHIRVRIYQRDDLSGDYVVSPSGSIVMPILGTFDVAGHEEEQISREIAQAAQKAMERSVDVVVEVTQRRPIYVIGYVEHPGVYPFALGMTVVHAMSLAGGTYRPPQSQASEIVREFGNLEQSSTLKHDITRLARLKTERDGRPFTEVPAALLEVASDAEAHELVIAEQHIQAIEAEGRKIQSDAAVRALQLAEEELGHLTDKIAQIDKQIALNSTEASVEQDLASRGFVGKTKLNELNTSNAALKVSKLDALANIARAQQAVETIKNQIATADVTRRRDLDEQITTLTAQIDSLRTSIQNTHEVVENAAERDRLGRRASGEPHLVYTIMRHTAKGYVFLLVSDVAPLLPGDVLRVSAKAEQ
jgi:protein involved in polysaccharide export with SLBB domain